MLHSPPGQGDDYVGEGHHVSNSHLEAKSSKGRRKKGAASTDAAPFLRKAAEYKGYVNVEQSEETKRHYAQWSDDADLVSEFTTEVLHHGYKISVVSVDDHETFKATAYAAFSGMPDEGLNVSAWADSFFGAWNAVVYIVSVQAQFNLSTFDNPALRTKRRTF